MGWLHELQYLLPMQHHSTGNEGLQDWLQSADPLFWPESQTFTLEANPAAGLPDLSIPAVGTMLPQSHNGGVQGHPGTLQDPYAGSLPGQGAGAGDHAAVKFQVRAH